MVEGHPGDPRELFVLNIGNLLLFMKKLCLFYVKLLVSCGFNIILESFSFMFIFLEPFWDFIRAMFNLGDLKWSLSGIRADITFRVFWLVY